MLFTELQDADIWLDEHPAYQGAIWVGNSGHVAVGDFESLPYQNWEDWDAITRRELLEFCCQ